MTFHSELKSILWGAFHAGGKWALDATEKKGELNPTDAFNAWLEQNAFDAWFEENKDRPLAQVVPHLEAPPDDGT